MIVLFFRSLLPADRAIVAALRSGDQCQRDPYADVSIAYEAPVPPFFGYHYMNSARDAGVDAALILQIKAAHFEMIVPWSFERKVV